MSISSAFQTALSGLKVSGRLAEMVSSNIANALTPGYVRREGDLSANALSQGVRLASVRRDVDLTLMNERRVSEATVGERRIKADHFKALEIAINGGDGNDTLSSRVAAFDGALIAAGARPESEVQLSTVYAAAKGLVSHITKAADQVQQGRMQADQRIEAEVKRLNAALAQVEKLNLRIQSAINAGQDASALMDMRQQKIDEISQIVPIREVSRENGVVSLFTVEGAALLDGRASVLAFRSTYPITADKTYENGDLGGITLNGQAVSAHAGGMLEGGSLAANFAVRDIFAPHMQAQLDGLARDLIRRFEAAGLDKTQTAGAAGLFTDNGQALDPALETGLAGRLRLNDAVNPDAGGALWRLRDGLGATVQGPVGNGGFLSALQKALSAPQAAAAPLEGGNRSFAQRSSDFLSQMARGRVEAEGEMSFAAAHAATLQQQEKARGVDSDQEMQHLMVIEKHYAANARVMQAVDDMFSQLMGMMR